MATVLEFVQHSGEQKIPIVRVRINERDCYTLFDTGAEISVLDKDICNNGTKDTKAKGDKLIMLTGKNLKSGGKHHVMFDFYNDHGKKKAFVVSGISADLSSAKKHFDEAFVAVIGSDFLSEHEAVIDYEKEIVIINK